MNPPELGPADDQLVSKTSKNQLSHFTAADQRCQGVELPQGVMLRYNGESPMYFFLETEVVAGKICTKIFASDSPYDKKKSNIGEIMTAMFEQDADMLHLQKVEGAVRDWVLFVSTSNNGDEPFSSFSMERSA